MGHVHHFRLGRGMNYKKLSKLFFPQRWIDRIPVERLVRKQHIQYQSLKGIEQKSKLESVIALE